MTPVGTLVSAIIDARKLLASEDDPSPEEREAVVEMLDAAIHAWPEVEAVYKHFAELAALEEAT